MKKIFAVTVGRSDFSIYLPVLKRALESQTLDLSLIVGGAHLDENHPESLKEIERSNIPIVGKVGRPTLGDRPQDISSSVGDAIVAFSQFFEKHRPDLLLVLGDRYDMLPPAVAALPFKIPVAHIHGGEVTEGAIDDSLRHCLTKLSHLHFVTTQEYAERVIQLGEEPWRVTLAGAPALDNLIQFQPTSTNELEKELGLSLTDSLLVTFHPTTLEYEKTEWQTSQLLSALEKFSNPQVITLPNADTAHNEIIEKLKEYAKRPNVVLRENLGPQRYFSLLQVAKAMVGNSSSGIIESASFCLPVVNIGDRQKGRVRAKNVIDVAHDANDIEKGLRKACSPLFAETLKNLKNPYNQGGAAKVIVEKLETTDLNALLTRKRFQDLKEAA